MTSTPPDTAAGATANVSVTVASTSALAAPPIPTANGQGHEQHHPELTPTDTYQVDSSEFDSGSDVESLPEEEYEALVQEGAHSVRVGRRMMLCHIPGPNPAASYIY